MRRKVAFGVMLLSGVITHATGCGDLLGSSDDNEPPPPRTNADADATGDGNSVNVDGATGDSESDGGGPVVDAEAGVTIDSAVDGAGSAGTWKCALVRVSDPEDAPSACKAVRNNDPSCEVTADAACTVGEQDRGGCDPCTTSFPFEYNINTCTCQ